MPLKFQVKRVFDDIVPSAGLSVGLAVGQSSIADEIAALIQMPEFEAGFCYDPEDYTNRSRSGVDILVATPGRLIDHINTTKGFTLEHLQYLVGGLPSLLIFCIKLNMGLISNFGTLVCYIQSTEI